MSGAFRYIALAVLAIPLFILVLRDTSSPVSDSIYYAKLPMKAMNPSAQTEPPETRSPAKSPKKKDETKEKESKVIDNEDDDEKGEPLETTTRNPKVHDWKTTLSYIHIPDPERCEKKPIFISIRTVSDDFEYRDKWRRSFGRLAEQHNFGYAFFIGLPRNTSSQAGIDAEFKKYGDIVQNNYYDAYRNVTYKTLASFSYFAAACEKTTVMMKVDDDIYFQFAAMENLVKEFNRQDYGMVCQIIRGVGPIRRNTSKWQATEEEYPGDKYPPYCRGTIFHIKWRAAAAILKTLDNAEFFWVDDVFVTGVLRLMANETIGDFRDLFEHPYIASNAKLTFRYFVNNYPHRLCNDKDPKHDCVGAEEVFYK